MGVVQEAIEQRGDGGGVAQQLAPVVDGSVRRQERGRPLIAAHDDFEQIFGRGVRQFAHAEIIDDEQRDRGQLGQEILARALERRVGDLLEQDMGLTSGGNPAAGTSGCGPDGRDESHERFVPNRSHQLQSLTLPNGKVERFFRTVDDECLALQRRWSFEQRTRAVERFVWFYNHERPHLSLHGMKPVERRDEYFRSSTLELLS